MDALQTDRTVVDGWNPTSGDVVDMLLRIAAHISAVQARRLRPISLSPSAFTVLLHLAGAPGERLEPCTLAGRLSVSRPSICGLLDGLEAKGLVARTPHGHDGRRVLVELSATGRQLLDEHRSTYDGLLDSLLDDLNDGDRVELIGLLQRIAPGRP